MRTDTSSLKAVPYQTWTRLRNDLWKDRYLYIIFAPVLVFYIMFHYVPLYGIQIAFKKYNIFAGITQSPWVGLDQFVKFFSGPYFWRTLKNTFAISFYGLVFGFPIPIILALLLNEVKTVWYKKTVQTLSYLPHFVSSVVIAGIAVNFLSPSHGLVNNIITFFGGERIYFLIQPQFFRTIFTSINIWAGAGFASIIYIAALSGVDSELYEAAKIDGAGKWKQLWNITLPGILPTIVIMLILRIGQLLNVGYEMIILLYQPSTYETGDVISSYVYRQAFQGADYSLATAVDLFDSMVALILVFAANKISKKITDTGIW
ncbi:MAG: sugar transporter permease [Paenibacillaceae bacterium]|nr:sugar transporter permease [Paenibacillaceae bacterium]